MRLALLLVLGLVGCGGSSSTDDIQADAGVGGGGGVGGGVGGASGGSGGDGNTPGIELDGGGGRVENPTCSGVIATTDPSELPSVPAGIDPEFVEWGGSPRVVVASDDEAIVAWSYNKSNRWRRYRNGTWLEREAVAGSEAGPTLAGLVAAPDGTAAVAYHEQTPGGYALCSRIARGDGTAASDTVDWTTHGWWQDPVPPVLTLGRGT